MTFNSKFWHSSKHQSDWFIRVRYIARLFFFSGESIAISAMFENYSSRTVIPYATLHQTQTFFANGKCRARGTKFTVLTGTISAVRFVINWVYLQTRKIIGGSLPHYAICHTVFQFQALIKFLVAGLPVAPGNRATWDAQLLKIPAVSPSIVNCCVIKVDYYVKVC